MFISYAQNFEDVMLWRALKHVKNGFYLDIGAQHPIIDSVSMAFYEHGWRGVHVEPNTHYAQLLREFRPDETVIQAAISNNGEILKFYEITDTGLSTCQAEIAERHRASGFTVNETSVPSVTLANVFESCTGREIHWLKIDVEGLEDQVLHSWTPSESRPWIIVVESTLPLTQIESHEKWEMLILNLDYEFVYFDGLNRYYLAKKHPELKNAFRTGPNVFDNFTLSGTASTTFCSLLNNQLTTREQELVAQIAQDQAELAEVNEQLVMRNEELAVKKTEIIRLTQLLATREQELVAQIAQDQAELAEVNEQLAMRNEELAVKKAEVIRLTQLLATREQELGLQIVQGQTELTAVYHSKSWRLTRSLREANLFVNQRRRQFNSGVSLISSLPHLTARFILRHAFTYKFINRIITKILQSKIGFRAARYMHSKIPLVRELTVKWKYKNRIQLSFDENPLVVDNTLGSLEQRVFNTLLLLKEKKA